jgi:DNA-directed RNA polymerase specialized sigma24 family protein
MNRRSPPAPVVKARPASNDYCAKYQCSNDAVYIAFARVRAWRTPPHWSTCDWLDEARAILDCAAASAGRDYDQTRGVPLRAYIYMQAVAAAWNRYRQEWSYYLHSAIDSTTCVDALVMPFDQPEADETIHHFVGQALGQLPIEDQLLMRQLFWNQTREKRLAAMLEVSQQEVSRRKLRVLRLLRQNLGTYGALLLSQLGSLCLTILDPLDVIRLVPGFNLPL